MAVKDNSTYIHKAKSNIKKNLPDLSGKLGPMISHSQFSMYQKCPYSWRLKYIDRLIKDDVSIHLDFGNAIHHAIQEYVKTMYVVTAKAADMLDLDEMFGNKFIEEYENNKNNKNNGEHYVTRDQFFEFMEDGYAILDEVKKNRSRYFPKKGCELVGIELPLYHPVSESNSTVRVFGYLDIVLRDTDLDKYIIIDIKTSGKGWSKYDKADKVKVNQLNLYKQYFAKQFGVDINSIDVQYMIVKRKVNEEAEYANMKKRVQLFSPPSGKVTQNMLLREAENFVNHAFDEEGNRNASAEYLPVSSSQCRFCPVKDDHAICPPDKRVQQIKG